MDRVFRWIRRVNSVLFLLVLIGGSFGAYQLYIGYRDMLASYSNVSASDELPVESVPDPTRLVLGEADRVYGTDIVAIVLFSEEGRGGKRAQRRHEQMRNVLFLSENGARATWLFEEHSNVLVEFDGLRRGEQPTRAFYYEIEGSEETDDDALTVALSKPDGSNLTEILTGVTRVLSYERIDDRALAVIYETGDKLWHARFDLETFAKLSEQPLVDVPQQM
jgi:hypothetical protein